MTNERESWFALLEPPPGGVARLRARMAEPRRMLLRDRLVAASGIAAVAGMVAFLMWLAPDLPRSGVADDAIFAARELDRLLGRESDSRRLTVERDDQPVEIEELPSTDPRVRIYGLL